MGELKETISSCTEKLSLIFDSVVDESQRSNLITQKCYDRILNKAELYSYLKQTLPMFELREKAWDILISTILSENVIDESILAVDEVTSGRPKVKYCDSSYHFDVARHHSLVAYLSITWSVYDRLFNVFGRISSNDIIAKEPTSNPKISITLDPKKCKQSSFSGFNILEIIFDSHAWYIDVLLSLRNWLVHDGTTTDFDGKKLFKSSEIVDGYTLHDEAICYINEKNRGKLDELDDTDPWKFQNIDLLLVLENYIKKLDTMFEKTLTWTIDSFENQVKIFALKPPV